MDIGVVFPQIEMDDDQAVSEYAQTAEKLGFDHILAYDHVLGVDPDRPNWEGPYDYKDPFFEPLVLFSHLAGITESIDFVTGVLILPQRQTALVAKQAATLDVLSGGRLRLGVGVGWNKPEYDALGEDFSTRGKRESEQIEVLQELWTNELVSFDGEYHTIDEAGINPLPVQKPIPIWVGGMAEPTLKRVAKFGDGWLPQFEPGPKAEEMLERLYKYTREAGRDPEQLVIHGRMNAPVGENEQWSKQVSQWEAIGADMLAINTMNQGHSPSDHIDQIREIAKELDI